MARVRARRLVIKGELTQDGQGVIVSVISQSHKGKAFYPRNSGEFSLGEHPNRCRIKSDCQLGRTSLIPQEDYVFETSYGLTVYVNGASRVDKLTGAVVKIKHWPLLKEAVLAYNAEGKKEVTNDKE